MTEKQLRNADPADEAADQENEQVLDTLASTLVGKTRTYDEQYLIERIRSGLRKTVEGFIMAGRWLAQAAGQEPYSKMTTQEWDTR